MQGPNCFFKAHLDSVTSRHSRWLTFGPVPQYLQPQAARRLGLMALFVAFASGVLMVVFGLTLAPQADRFRGLYENSVLGMLPPVLVICMILLSIVIFGLSRLTRFSRTKLLLLGCFYQIVLAFLFGLLHHLHTWKGFWIYTGWSHVAVLIIVFAIMVPASPGRTLIVSVLSALMDPFTLFMTVRHGAPMPSHAMLAMLFTPTALAVGAAVVTSDIVHRLGRDIQKAQELGSYQLVERLGQGGMGEVWRAEHNTLARPAAVKLIRPDALAWGGEDGEMLVRRFEREAQATAALQSEHTIGLYDFGREDDGAFYYVMELLVGVDLENYVERFGAMPPDRVAHVLVQCCHSLAEAHHRGMIHRDIKPANIYLCRQGLDYDYVKVLDFGLVKQTFTAKGGGTLEGTKLTMEGQISGTPAYMAPEMAMGETEVDGRADLYALGCVAYWLLTGRPVFSAKSPIKMLMMHLNETPEPPSTYAAVDPELDRAVLACLAKDPADRPQTAGELSAGLEALAAGWSNVQAAQWWKEHLPEMEHAPPADDHEPSVAPTIPMESPRA